MSAKLKAVNHQTVARNILLYRKTLLPAVTGFQLQSEYNVSGLVLEHSCPVCLIDSNFRRSLIIYHSSIVLVRSSLNTHYTVWPRMTCSTSSYWFTSLWILTPIRKSSVAHTFVTIKLNLFSYILRFSLLFGDKNLTVNPYLVHSISGAAVVEVTFCFQCTKEMKNDQT